MYKSIIIVICLAIVSSMVTGCQTGDKKDYHLSIHEFSKRQKEDFFKLEYEPDEYIYINPKAVIKDLDFKSATTFEKNGKLGLNVQLTTHGNMIWMQKTANMFNQQLVIVLDGKYKNWIKIKKLDTSGTLQIPAGALKNEEVKGVLDKSKDNFNQNFIKDR
jgi:hypothetical protein